MHSSSYKSGIEMTIQIAYATQLRD